MTYRTIFRTPYLVRIKVSILNQSKNFNSPIANDKRSSLLSLPSNFLVNPLLTSVYSTYKLFILDGFLGFLVFLFWFGKNKIKKLLPFLVMATPVFEEQGRGVFIPYNFSYLYLGPISFKCIIFPPQLFFL
jgi:hypothetical protein